ncbi:hypothetical protein [Glaciihabitans sp. dw_435]|uniref:hypothetical protein n=1 Tax=Glaciihabitans sp. dw_435 TaxID=2720081 RepID=UPI001BD2E8CD|nr:hypothetical protein [Glaciihabitans sp. dw_435]
MSEETPPGETPPVSSGNSVASTPSPGGTYVLETMAYEARSSAWVFQPHVLVAASRETVFAFGSGMWSADSAQWVDDSNLRLEVRKFPGGHQPSSLQIVIDCAAGSASTPATPHVALRQLEAALDKELTWPPPARARRSPRHFVGFGSLPSLGSLFRRRR